MSHNNYVVTQFLTFVLGGETFAADVTRVREVMDLARITEIPQSPPEMLGVLNLRGSVVPVIDLRRKFGVTPSSKSREACIIVLEVPCADDLLVVGAVADGVREVLDLSSDQIEPPPRFGLNLHSDYLLGMGKHAEQFILLLDTDRLFSDAELAAVHMPREEAG